MAYQIGSTADGGVRWSDGRVTYPSSQAPKQSSNPNFSPASGYGTKVGDKYFVQTPSGGAWSSTPASSARGGDVLDVNTQQPTQQNNTPNTGNSWDDAINSYRKAGWNDEASIRGDINAKGGPDAVLAQMRNNAQSSHSANLESIRRRLDEAKRQASVKRQRANEEKDYVTGTIGDQISTLISRAGQQRDNTNAAFTREESTLDNVYNKAIGNARRRSSSIEQQNRNRARAMNRLDSSFYDDIQAANAEDTKRGMGEIDMERADKMANIGQRRTESDQFYENTVTDLETEGARLKRDAISQYQAALDNAEALENAGMLDAGESEAVATAQLQSKLDAIDQYIQNASLRRMELETLARGKGTALDTYDPLSEGYLADLRSTPGIDAGTSTIESTPTIGMSGSGMQGIADFVTNLVAMGQRKRQQPALAFA